jgi:DNA polymerase-3 subunit gamma/tau
MAYQALYRKWRPVTFDDVRGQDHIVTTLKNQMLMDRVGHAYLFCGTRGTGKTSVAKILARAVNCEHPKDGNPCNECAMCRAVNEQHSMNVVEIDAASNNGVDNIREIIEEVAFPPAEGRYKVYIIDEVHMLSPGAYNALLKTLEEPPSYVIFILATTEPHRLPITILSRCQRYDFRRITTPVIARQLQDLADREQIDAEEEALGHIARVADGSMRDALSLLDQCSSFYIGQKLTLRNVLDVLGAVDSSVFGRMLRAVAASDAAAALTEVAEVSSQGRDLTQFTLDFTWYLRNLLLFQCGESAIPLLDVTAEQLADMREEIKLADSGALTRYIRILSRLAGQMRYSAQKRVLLETELIKMCRPDMERRRDELEERIAYLEKMMDRVLTEGVSLQAPPSGGGQALPKKPVRQEKVPVQAASEDVLTLIAEWETFRKSLPEQQALILDGADVQPGGGNLLQIAVTDAFGYSYYTRSDTHKKELEKALTDYIGKELQASFRLQEKKETEAGPEDDITQMLNLDGVIYEEED